MSIDANPIIDTGTSEPLATSFLEAEIPRYGFSVKGLNILQNPHLPSQFSTIEKIYTLPHSPPWFSGLVNQHNTLIPVYDLAILIDTVEEKQPQQKKYLLTIQMDANVAGLLIDDIPQQIFLGQAKPTGKFGRALPEMIETSIKAVYWHQNKNWIEFSFQKLFLALAEHNK
ncbi:MAG: chemotaxis protein CheW [Alcanivoracaceae bacterium]|nr:chemotaxis protein CheW [Alcanivoracaceae bacterium]